MSQRVILFGLRSRLLLPRERCITQNNSVRSIAGLFAKQPCHYNFQHEGISSVHPWWRRCKSTRILSDDMMADDASNDVLEEKYYVDPETKRLHVRSDIDTGNDGKEQGGDRDGLFYDTRNKFSKVNQGGAYISYEQRHKYRPRPSPSGEDRGEGYRNAFSSEFGEGSRLGPSGYDNDFSSKFGGDSRRGHSGRYDDDEGYGLGRYSRRRADTGYGRADTGYGRGDTGYGRGRFGRDRQDDSYGRSTETLWEQLNEREVDFSNESAVEKNFYSEHQDVLRRPEEEVQQFLKENQMSIKGPNVKKPILKFTESGFSGDILEFLNKMTFSKPTPIQSIGWPHALSGQDFVGVAQTGSGKTLSFLLPAILHVQEQRRTTFGDGPIALVLCPTRELAMQCQTVVKKFSRLCKIRSVVVYGGQPKTVQEENLSRPGLDMVIATPGRLLDFLTMGVVSLKKCSFVVLDEADRMLDMGFEPQVRSILRQIRPDRQVLMWSATWPEEIRELASDFLKDYVHVKIGSQTNTVNANITQLFEACNTTEKFKLLLDHLYENRDERNPKRPAKTLVFATTKVMCSRLERMLRSEGIRTASIHGSKTQRQRDDAMHDFRTGRVNVLVASDVAARGLDVTDIEYVVNYDLPLNIENYIHRVGRTARAGRKGTALSFITVDDLDMVQPLIKVLEDVGHEVPELLQKLLVKRTQLKSYRKRDRVNQNYMGGGAGKYGSGHRFRY